MTESGWEGGREGWEGGMGGMGGISSAAFGRCFFFFLKYYISFCFFGFWFPIHYSFAVTVSPFLPPPPPPEP